MAAPSLARVPLALLLVAALAVGCLARDGEGDAAVSPAATPSPDTAATTATTMPREVSPPAPTGANSTEHNITVDIHWAAGGYDGGGPYAGWDTDCDPARPAPCGVYNHETMTPASPELFNGTFDDEAHITLGTSNGAMLWGTWTFTGTITGCGGGGAVVFPFTAEADDQSISASSGREFVHGHEILTTPTSWEGFVGFGDAWMDAEFNIDPITGIVTDGTLTGYLHCE